MVYRNNAGRLGSDFSSVCLETRWVGQKSCLYVKNDPVPVSVGFLFFLGWYPQASISSTAGTHTGGDAVLGKPEGSPARRHSRNSCHMSVYIVVCACSQHALDFEYNCLDLSFHERATA